MPTDKTTIVRWTRRRIHLIKALAVRFPPITRHVRSVLLVRPSPMGVCTIRENETIIHGILSWSDAFRVATAYNINKIVNTICLSRISVSV